MKVANHTPATRFGVTQQKFSRHRAASKPPMRNAVTLVVLEHVRTCKFPIPAVCVDVKDPKKICHNHCAARKWARPPCKTLCQPAARSSARDAGRQTTKSRQTPPPPQDPPICCSRSKKTKGSGRGAGMCEPQPPTRTPRFFKREHHIGGSGGVGAFGAISSFALRRRGCSCVRLAGIGLCKADVPTFWPRSD